MKTKKIVLFIVEGFTDQASIALILSKIIQNENVKFHIAKGDITSDKFSNAANALSKVDNQIKAFLKRNAYLKKSDIISIVHLIDTDGAFISDDKIEKGEVDAFFYTSDKIIAKSVVSVMDRNHRKNSVVDRLSTCLEVSKIKYTMYYFSCNLEHVLHNTMNLNDRDKMDYANQFADSFYGREAEFISFISDEDFAVKGTFKETWEFIKLDENSLKRFSNFHLFFKDDKPAGVPNTSP